MIDKSKHTTAVVLTADQFEMLREVAMIRTLRGDTARMSVSEVVREAVDTATPALRAEIAQHRGAGQ